VEPSPLLLRTFIGLFYQHWMIDVNDYRAISGMNELAEETEVMGDNLPQRRSVHHRSPMTMKNGVLWDVTPCGSCNNRRFGGT
jgi:hypothetical protein